MAALFRYNDLANPVIRSSVAIDDRKDNYIDPRIYEIMLNGERKKLLWIRVPSDPITT